MERYRVDGELPENAELTGLEAESDGGETNRYPLRAAAVQAGGKYYWPDYLWQGPGAAAFAARDNDAGGEPARR